MATRTNPKPKDDSVQITVRLNPDVVKRLDDACDKRVVGRNLLVSTAIERLLDTLEPVENALLPAADVVEPDGDASSAPS